MECLGKYFPNVPVLGAVIKVTGIIPENEAIKDMEESLKHKFATKPDVIEGNLKAFVRGMQEVQG